jgi:hypothetical protein
MKIDVEGHESAVLAGARDALTSGRVEHVIYEDVNGRDSAVHALLADAGYSIFALGWHTHKPALTSADDGPCIDRTCESPNYLATRSPATAVQRFRRWGWSVF